jgi:hypothetical protein
MQSVRTVQICSTGSVAQLKPRSTRSQVGAIRVFLSHLPLSTQPGLRATELLRLPATTTPPATPVTNPQLSLFVGQVERPPLRHHQHYGCSI